MSQLAIKSSDLPEVRGRYTENAPLGEMGWFKCGGRAEVLFKPADLEDLREFLSQYSPSPQPFPRRGDGVSHVQNRALSPPGRGLGEGVHYAPKPPEYLIDNAKSLRRTQTDCEQKLWFALKDRRFSDYKFRRQHPVPPYIVDFVCLEKKVIIEADGGQHNENEGDKKRDAFLRSQGFEVLRFWNNEIAKNFEGVLETIKSALGENPLTQPSPRRGEGFVLENGERAINVFGALSNTIIRDGGLPGVTIRLGREFAGIEVVGDTVIAGALALDANVAQVAAEAGIGGLEFLSGIPGTVGGALRMNAGCYGTEVKDVLVSCDALDRSGRLVTLAPEQMHMSYRHNDLPEDFIFVSATFKGQKDNAQSVLDRMAEIKLKRETSQPIREKTGGSTFANPSAEEIVQAEMPEGTKVWQLIDAVGGRGLKIGGAVMSEKHCNFMINEGGATAADLENLGEEIRRRVLEKFGISLRWEIKRVGFPL